MDYFPDVCLQMPLPREHSIHREKPLQKLQQAKCKRLIMIVGDAGMGKTTLAAQHIQSQETAWVWIGMLEALDDPFIFCHYVMVGCERLHPTHDIDQHLASIESLAHQKRYDLLTMLMQGYLMNFPELLLVIDDAHLITNQPLLHLLEQLLASCMQLRIMLIARKQLSLYVKQIIMHNEFLTLTNQDFLWNIKEEMLFLQQTLQLEAAPAKLLKLCDQANGWIGGLQLLTMAADQQQDMPQIQNAMLEAYLKREVFAMFEEPVKQFLCKTSILQSFDPWLIAEYLPAVNFAKMMQELQYHHVILLLLHKEKQVYRYHDLIKDFLVQQFQTLAWEEQKSCHLRVASILYQRHAVAAALYHLFEIKEYDLAMQYIASSVKTSEIVQYMNRIPLTYIKGNADFAYQLFFYSYAGMNLQRPKEIFTIIQDNLKQDPTFAAFRWSKYFIDQSFLSKQAMIMPLEDIEKLPLSKETIGFLMIRDAFFLYTNGDYQRCFAYLQRAYQHYQKTNNPYVGIMYYLIETQILEQLGYFLRALQAYDQMAELPEMDAFQGVYHLGAAGVYMKQLRIKEANAHLQQCLQKVNEEASLEEAGLYTLAQLYYLMKDERAIPLTQKVLHRYASQHLLAASSLLRLYYLQKPQDAVFQDFIQVYTAFTHFRDPESILLRCTLYVQENNLSAAEELVKQLLVSARKNQNHYVLVDASLNYAKLALQRGNQPRLVKDLLCEAILYAYKELICLPFYYLHAIRSKLDKDLLHQLKQTIHAPAYLFFMKVMQLKAEDQLSKREAEVLEEISRGYTNKEIADHMMISLATVKTHLINIYKKLDVTNRMEAVQKYGRNKDDPFHAPYRK